MTEQEKLALLEDMLELDEGTLSATDELDDVENWDSMAKLSLIVLIDEKCGKKLTGNEIKQFSTIGDILNYMS